MKELIALLLHLLTTIATLLGPGGAQAVVAGSLLMKQQLLIVNRSRKRAPNLTATDGILLGFWSLFLGPRRIRRSAIIIKPSTLLRFQEILKNATTSCSIHQAKEASRVPRDQPGNLS